MLRQRKAVHALMQWAVEICYKKVHRRFRQSISYNFPTFHSTVLEFCKQSIPTHIWHLIIVLQGRTMKYQGLFYILCGIKMRALTITYSLPQGNGSETTDFKSITPDAYVMFYLNISSLC
jgi:hypothetical protein